jgi:hypothetical protein
MAAAIVSRRKNSWRSASWSFSCHFPDIYVRRFPDWLSASAGLTEIAELHQLSRLFAERLETCRRLILDRKFSKKFVTAALARN